MKAVLGWILLSVLVTAIYVPYLNNLSFWSWQVVGIPIQVLLWLFAPVLAAGALVLIIPKSPSEGPER